uniref:Uncharacterized protein n=1 Tax=viral metagenome TaxID=1070528 RepID=A0A6H1ZD49_9ZZZZ
MEIIKIGENTLQDFCIVSFNVSDAEDGDAEVHGKLSGEDMNSLFHLLVSFYDMPEFGFSLYTEEGKEIKFIKEEEK